MSAKIKVKICSGTACYVMGGSDILLLEENLSASLRDKVEIEGTTCLGNCKNGHNSKAPYVSINDTIIEGATLPDIILRIQELVDAEYK
jgi:NADH:ubiquinone oxidoreductase subunit E